MQDIRQFIPIVTPLIFKNDVKLLFVNNNYIAYNMTENIVINIHSEQPKETAFYSIIRQIIPAKIITIDHFGCDENDYLIAWFDGVDIAIYKEAFIGVAKNTALLQKYDFINVINDVDEYDSLVFYDTEETIEHIENNVITLDIALLETMVDINDNYYRRTYNEGILDLDIENLNKHKIAIPDEIQPIATDDYSNIRIAKFDLKIFGGNSVFPFVWLQKNDFLKK